MSPPETRFAHTEGITDVAITPDGKKLLTCGSDGDVRIYNDFEDEDPVTFSASDSCLSMLANKDVIYIGTDNHRIEMFELPKGKPLGVKTKFTAGVNHIDISADGRFLVGGAGDMTLQLILLNDSSVASKKIESAHQAPVLSVAIDPLSRYVASSGCDGCICIWSISISSSSISAAMARKFERLFPKSSDVLLSPTLCRLTWSPSGNHIAFPKETNQVAVLSRDNWKEEFTLSHKEVTKILSVIRFSQCGTFIAAGGTDGSIIVWDFSTKNCVFYANEPNAITSLVFAPNSSLYLADDRGRFIYVKNFSNKASLPSNTEQQPHPVADTRSSKTATNEIDANNSEKDVFDDGMDGIFVDDEDDDNSISISKIKAAAGFVDDEYVGRSKALKGIDLEDEDDAISVLSGATGPRPQIVHHAPPVNPFTDPQETFQPSSTPVNLDHRFMVWNNVAVIRNYSTDDDDEAIDIEFHDVNFHAAIHLRNQFGFTMAAVSTEAVIFACEKDEEHPSKLFCLNYSTWDSSREWTIDMSKHEDIKCIAIGKGWIAAFTSLNRLRFFSIGGVQNFMYDLPSQVVSMSGHENLLFVAYHNGVGIKGNQSNSYSIYQIKGCRLQPLISEASLPLSVKACLSWIGFTDEGTPVYYDSKNILRILNGTMWTPFSCMKELLNGPNNHFWIVGVSETSQNIRAVRCKGNRYPPTIPRPILMLVDAKIPLCELDTEKSQLEDGLLRAYFMNCAAKKMEKKGYDLEDYKDEADRIIKENLMKLFVLSTKGDRDFRAAEYISLMPSSHSVQVAIKYASRLHRTALTERLTTIGRKKLESEDIDDDDDFDFETHNKTNYIHITRNESAAGSSQPFINNSFSAFESFSQNSRCLDDRDADLSNNSLTMEENPLLKKQRDAIRAIAESPLLSGSNPFRKEKETPKSNNTESQEIIENGNSSKGISVIDAWKKIPDKATIVEFNPKNALRKLTKKADKEKDGVGVKKRKSDKALKDGKKDNTKKQKLLSF